MKRLIVNADDFGFTRGVNEGILRAHRNGIVTSTTIMANGDAFNEAVEAARANPSLGVGCHLSAVGGRPVSKPSEIPTLVDRDGLLPPTLGQLLMKFARRSVSTDDIAAEFRAQLARITGAGITPTHLDTHKHSHTHPQVMRALAQVAAEFGVVCVRNPFESIAVGSLGLLSSWKYLKQAAKATAIQPGAIRFRQVVAEYGLKTTDRFLGVRLTGMLDVAAIRSMMKSLTEGTSELMCHPGLYDDELEKAQTRLKQARERELDAVSDPELRRFAEEHGIELISYRSLSQ